MTDFSTALNNALQGTNLREYADKLKQNGSLRDKAIAKLANLKVKEVQGNGSTDVSVLADDIQQDKRKAATIVIDQFVNSVDNFGNQQSGGIINPDTTNIASADKFTLTAINVDKLSSIIQNNVWTKSNVKITKPDLGPVGSNTLAEKVIVALNLGNLTDPDTTNDFEALSATPAPTPPAPAPKPSPTPPPPPPAPKPPTLDPNETPENAVKFLVDNKANFQAVKDQWNAWRKADTEKVFSLAGQDLSGTDFTNADLTEGNLIGAKLVGAKLVGATLDNADLFRSGNLNYFIQDDGNLKVYNPTDNPLTDASYILATPAQKQAFLTHYEKLKGQASTIGEAIIGGQKLGDVIKQFKSEVAPILPPKQPEAEATNQTTTTEPEIKAKDITSIDETQLGGLLSGDENKVYRDTNKIQAALNEKIQAGEIKIDGQKVTTLLKKDGIFGDNTEAVAKAWLDANKSKTLASLVETTKAPDAKATIFVGQTSGNVYNIPASGAEVTAIQKALNTKAKEAEFTELKPDGEYGALTKAAVMAFQKFYNKGKEPEDQLEIDGIVGVGTLSALGVKRV